MNAWKMLQLAKNKQSIYPQTNSQRKRRKKIKKKNFPNQPLIQREIAQNKYPMRKTMSFIKGQRYLIMKPPAVASEYKVISPHSDLHFSEGKNKKHIGSDVKEENKPMHAVFPALKISQELLVNAQKMTF